MHVASPLRLKELVATWVSIQKSAVSFEADLASTERPDQMLARANAFMARLEDTAVRADGFEVQLRVLMSELSTKDYVSPAESLVSAAEALERGVPLEALEDEVLSVVGRQMAQRLARYNVSVTACENARRATVDALRVAGGVLSVRHIRGSIPG
jgi:hypothetical protein